MDIVFDQGSVSENHYNFNIWGNPHQNEKPLLYVISCHGKDVESDVVGFPAIPGAMLLTFLINFGMEDVYDVLVDPECGKEAVPRCEPSTYQPICR